MTPERFFSRPELARIGEKLLAVGLIEHGLEVGIRRRPPLPSAQAKT